MDLFMGHVYSSYLLLYALNSVKITSHFVVESKRVELWDTWVFQKKPKDIFDYNVQVEAACFREQHGKWPQRIKKCLRHV